MAQERKRRHGDRTQRDASLFAQLEPLAAEIEALRERARTLGLFSEDRALLECSVCGLREDVTAEGQLITYVGTERREDSGLRFDERRDGVFVCPSCRAEVAEPEAES